MYARKGVPAALMRFADGGVVERAVDVGERKERAGGLRPFHGHDERAVPGRNERVVESAENLLCAAHLVGAHRGQRIDAQDAESHATSLSRNC
jgi:hypothetical protein